MQEKNIKKRKKHKKTVSSCETASFHFHLWVRLLIINRLPFRLLSLRMN
jgi:hypothetical protein